MTFRFLLLTLLANIKQMNKRRIGLGEMRRTKNVLSIKATKKWKFVTQDEANEMNDFKENV